MASDRIDTTSLVLRQGNGSAAPAHIPTRDAPLGVIGTQLPRCPGLGLYIHVPFCTKRCHYCSFNTAPLQHDEEMRRYVRAARAEIEILGAAPWARDIRIETIFFGGGTPSLLASDDMAAILDSVRARFTVAGDVEVTVECNPESVSRGKLAAYRAAGVNRISLGVQSLDDGILPRLGRLHDAGGARVAFEAARGAGHDNVSVDLMYGLPEQDLATWARSIEGVLDWAPEHLSAYGLTLDAGSLWAVTGVANLPAEDTVVQQYWTLARAAASRGFEHYEISNYARPGFRSRHNQIYWRAAEYLAVGPGACGYLGDVRHANLKAVSRYCATLEAGALPIDTSEQLTPRQRLGERLMLGLRLIDGVPQAWLDERMAGDSALARRAQEWRDAGFMIARDDRIALTESGFLVSDAIFSELL